MMIIENQYHSYNLGELPEGCQYCVRGEKLVIFVTGLCPRRCSFCPLSDEKFQQDVSYANERKVFSTEDVLKEARLMKARGAGLTGGDPLSKLERTARFIKSLKKEFGASFHIHLYTSLRLVSEDKLQQLYMAGLDEIRFHLDLDSQQQWERMELAKKFPWKIGVEVPVIPGKEKELKNLINFISGKVDFLNLNELEIADNSHSKLLEMGFEVKDQLSYAVKGSLGLGLELLKYVQEKKLNLRVHLCTAKLKDAVQLANRLKREAKGAKHDFDLVDEEGLLTRGALYLPELAPGFSYRQKLKETNKETILAQLRPLLVEVQQKLKLAEREILLDAEKPRILISRKQALKHQKELRKIGLKVAIVTEYPTADQLEMEVEFLE